MHSDPSNTQLQYAHALKELRRGIGCAPEKLLEDMLLHRALQQRIEARREDATEDRLIAELANPVNSLSDPKLRRALLVALRMDPQYQQRSLMERRRRYNLVLRNSPDPELRQLHVDSLRTMERRENKAIEQVARSLYRGNSYLMPAQARFNDFPSPSDTPPDVLAVEEISYTCTFSETGVLEFQDVTRWVRATSTRTSPEITVTHRYFNGNGTAGLLRLESLYGCRVTESSETKNGDLLAKIKIHKNLTPGDGIYSFGSRIHVNSSIRCTPVIVWRPRTRATRRIEFHLNFHELHAPLRAWWFIEHRELSGALEPDPSDGRHLEVLDEGRYLYRIFERDNVSPDLRYGVAWVWPE